MATREEVVEFLRVFKSCIMLDRWSVKNRPENRQALIDLSVGPEDRKVILLGLEPEDYASGPTPDDTDDTKEVWVFGKAVGTQSTYIKLRVVEDPMRRGAHQAVVWSFHPAQYKLKYPLRGGRRP